MESDPSKFKPLISPGGTISPPNPSGQRPLTSIRAVQHLAKFREIVLHAGPAKTGTTSIQRALLKFRAELLSAGIYYPETEPPNGEGQHPLAWDILEADGTEEFRWSTARLSWQEVFDGAERAGAHTILISSEYFSSFRDDQAFRRLRSVAGDVPITLLFGLRDPVTLVRSHWQQGVKWAVGDGEELLSLDNAVPVLLQRLSVRVRPFIEMALTHLSPVRVRFFTVPGKPDTRLLLNQFGRAAGLPEPLLTRLSRIEAEAENQSLTEEDCNLLLALNQLLFSPDSKQAAHADRGTSLYLETRSWILEQLRRDSHSEKTTSKVTGESLRALVQLRADILSWLSENTFEVYGSLDALTSAGQDEARHEVGNRPQLRRSRASSTRLIEVLFNAMLTQTLAFRNLAPDKQQESALIIAAANGDTEKVKEVLDEGANVNTRDLDVGLTPLGHAAWFGHMDAAKLLIERGADINARKSNGTSVLMLATMRNHKDLADMLIKAGAK